MANTKTPARKGKKATSRGVAQGNTQLEKFFIDTLKDIYWAEKRLLRAMPKMQKAATTEQLQEAIEYHIEQTEEQVARLDQVFQLLGKKAQAKKCDAMEGLIKEGETAIEETEKGSMTRDVAIIVSQQKIEHYEIAAYGGLAQLALTMGYEEVADILTMTLDEEKQTDQDLTAIAEEHINWQAEQEDEEKEEA